MTFHEMHEVVKTQNEYAHLQFMFKRATDHISKVDISFQCFGNQFETHYDRIKSTIDECRIAFTAVKIVKQKVKNEQINLF